MIDGLISRKALFDEIKERYDLVHGETIIDPYYFAEMVMNAPAVDAEPVRHGRWEYYGNGTVSAYALCSMCGSGLAKEDAMHFDYCPYCGAKMDMNEAMDHQPKILKAEISLFDKEEVYENCTVQVLTNTTTGEVSVGWWQNDNAPEVLNE